MTQEGDDPVTTAPTSNRQCDFLPPLGLSFPIWHSDSMTPHGNKCSPQKGSPHGKLGPTQTSPAPLALVLDSVLSAVPTSFLLKLRLIPDPK